MTQTASPVQTGRFSGLSDLRLVGRQVRYEQLSFWLNPIGAIFTIGFSVVFLILLGASAGSSRVKILGNIKLIQYYVPGFVAYGVMSACFTALGAATSTLIPNEDAAAPVVNVVFFVLLFLSGLWFPIKDGSGLAQASGFFPIRHFIKAVFAPFNPVQGVSPWAWHDLLVVAIWGVAAAAFTIWRFRWAPYRNR